MRARLLSLFVLVALLPFLTGAPIVIRGPRVAAAGGPTLIATDNFDSYTNGDNLATVSANWDSQNGAVYIDKPTSNGAAYASGAQVSAYHNGTYSANQRVEGDLSGTGSGFSFSSISVRCQTGANTRYHLQVDGSVYYLCDVIAGSLTIISGHSGVSLTLVAGDKIALEANGTGSATRLKIQKDVGGGWVDVATNIDPGASHYIDGGTPGIGGDSGGNIKITEWRGYNL